MLQTEPTLVQIILRYDAPLQRYARMLVREPAVAAAIVKIAFEQVYEQNSFKASDKTLRRLFTGSVRRLCGAWVMHGRGRPRTTDDGRREGHGRRTTDHRRPQDHGRREKSPWSIVHSKDSQLHYQEHKNYYLLNRLKSKALSLLKTQFAKKPKNPT